MSLCSNDCLGSCGVDVICSETVKNLILQPLQDNHQNGNRRYLNVLCHCFSKEVEGMGEESALLDTEILL